MFLTSMQITN